jgi:hypothetical protein
VIVIEVTCLTGLRTSIDPETLMQNVTLILRKIESSTDMQQLAGWTQNRQSSDRMVGFRKSAHDICAKIIDMLAKLRLKPTSREAVVESRR